MDAKKKKALKKSTTFPQTTRKSKEPLHPD